MESLKQICIEFSISIFHCYFCVIQTEADPLLLIAFIITIIIVNITIIIGNITIIIIIIVTVIPVFRLRFLKLIPCLTNSVMTEECPCRAAMCTGVIPSWKIF